MYTYLERLFLPEIKVLPFHILSDSNFPLDQTFPVTMTNCQNQSGQLLVEAMDSLPHPPHLLVPHFQSFNWATETPPEVKSLP